VKNPVLKPLKHFNNPVTGETAPEMVDPTQYWIGNWPGEFGQKGRKEKTYKE